MRRFGGSMACHHLHSATASASHICRNFLRFFFTSKSSSSSRSQSLVHHSFRPFSVLHSPKGYCSSSGSINAANTVDSNAPYHGSSAQVLQFQDSLSNSLACKEDIGIDSPSDARVMLIDGTSIIYRAYYKLLAKLHHGYLAHADGNGDWVLTIFTALSLIVDVLEFVPSHVAVVFDHDGHPYGHTSNSSNVNFMAKGSTFRHTRYPAYKSNRPPTPDTIVQGLQYLKASIKSLSVQVIENSGVRSKLLLPNGNSINRRFSVFNEFSKKVKGEANKNPEFQRSVKDWKEKAEELKGVKEDLKVRTKQTTEQLYKQVDGVWSEAEAKARKVSADVKVKISAATEEVKEAFGFSHKSSSGSTCDSTDHDADTKKDGDTKKNGSETASEEAKDQHPGSSGSFKTVFGKFTSPGASSAFQRLKNAKLVDLTKRGYEIVKDELSGKPHKKKHLEYEPSSSPKVERSTRTDVTIVPSKQSQWSKKWEAFKEKMQGHPIFRRATGYSEPVVSKGQEIAEDIRERWETSDNPIVQKIQDINENMFQESDAATSFKEIRLKDPYFSLPDFVAEVQEAIKPVLTSYIKGDSESLKKYCSTEVIERCKAEHRAYESQGTFFDNKILHISEVEVRETKMMGSSPIIIVAFQTQQVYCVRDALGSIKEGGKDTIHTVYYAWAMQMLDPEEVGEGAPHAIWRVREMQQFGVQALI